VDPAVDVPTLVCARCLAELDGDPDEGRFGDAGRPICGECVREREAQKGMDDDLFLIDSLDGQLDGRLDLGGEWG
jgi:hypothetical protein